MVKQLSYRGRGGRNLTATIYEKCRPKTSEKPLKNLLVRGTFQEKVLTSSHFQNVEETKTSKALRDVLEKFQVSRGGSWEVPGPPRFFRGFWILNFWSAVEGGSL